MRGTPACYAAGVSASASPRPVRAVLRGGLAVLLLLVAGLVLGPLLAEQAQEWLAAGHMTAVPADAPRRDVALVLATAPMLVRDTPNPTFEARLDTAAALWKQGRARWLLVSGDGSPYGETWAMRRGLIERGVPGMAIYSDGDARRTWNSVLNAHDVFGLDRLLIVSQRAHLARALFLARSLGLDAYGVEAADPDPAPTWWLGVRPYLAAVLAYYDAWLRPRPPPPPARVRIGVDPPT